MKLALAVALLASIASAGAPPQRVAAAQPCKVIVFPPYGRYAASGPLHGPGLMLGGGGALEEPPSAFAWMHDRIVGATRARSGNVVVLRASGSDLYDKPFYQYGNFASEQTVFIPPCASRAQADSAAWVVRRADAVFFAGGDQANYVAWDGSKLIAAVKHVYARGGVVGGGSAGLAIQGAVVYDSRAADLMGVETHTADAVANPAEPRISFTVGMFAWPALARTITDTHFAVRDRFGRLVAFLARITNEQLIPPGPVYGLGVDQASVVVVDPDGMATVLNAPGGKGAYLLRGHDVVLAYNGGPLVYTVDVSHVARNGERFDLLHKTTDQPWYKVTVDGRRKPPYSRNPYGP
ncbi:MAG TPA: hypothetical protein VMF61_11035 [Candidatus Acidoferrales bacterium]|nr:hypothetical protein [Candidatus Acidoferrales bacterium]